VKISCVEVFSLIIITEGLLIIPLLIIPKHDGSCIQTIAWGMTNCILFFNLVKLYFDL